MATPFLKSAGGKTKLLPRILPHLPPFVDRYVEPFVGGGAVFFALQAAGRIGRAAIGDSNPDLIAAYRAVRDDVEALIRNLQDATFRNTEKDFLRVRAWDLTEVEKLCDSRRGARFLYLNKTCYSGLWRTNRAGQFNVPYGRYPRPDWINANGLRAAAAALRGVAILLDDFAELINATAPGPNETVAIYADPPYFPSSKTANFVGYGRGGFAATDQEHLENVARAAAARGVHVLLSNADTPAARATYPTPPWRLTRVERGGAINSNADDRGPVGELLIEGDHHGS